MTYSKERYMKSNPTLVDIVTPRQLLVEEDNYTADTVPVLFPEACQLYSFGHA